MGCCCSSGSPEEQKPPVAATAPKNMREMCRRHGLEQLADAHIVVFSKSYCPYCHQVKNIFSSLGVEPHVMELDVHPKGGMVQSELKKITGQSTVPNVFIGDKWIGGCDKVRTLHDAGALKPLLRAQPVEKV